MKKKQGIPKFKSEAEEAQWWYDNRDKTATAMEAAVAKGRTTTLSQILARARKNSGQTTTVSIRVHLGD